MDKKKLTALGLLSATCLTTNVYAQEYVYGEDIPKGEEDEYVFVENETLLDAYKDLSNEEANNLKVSLEASGYTTVTIKSYMVKTGVITNSIEEECATYNEALNYIESLKEKGIRVSNVEFINNTEKQDGSVNKTYNTLEEAEQALNNFKNEYNEDVTSEIKENKTNDIIDSIEGTTAYVTYEEAETALNEFLNNPNNNTSNFYFTGEVVGPKGTGVFTESEINEVLENAEKALEYLDNLRANGYIIVDFSFTNNTEKQDGSLNETYETLEQAEDAKSNFVNEYTESNQTTIIKVHDENEDVSENFSGNFATEAEANTYLNGYLSLNSDDVVVTGEVKENVVAGQSETFTETYTTLQAANEKLEELKSMYEVIESSNIEVVNAGTIYDAELVTSYETKYLVNDSAYIIIKKGGDIYVWTQNQLSADEQKEFKNTYPDFQVDPAINNINNAQFIFGINSEYITSNDKLFSIEEIDGKLYAVMAPGSVSHVVYGKFTPVTEYHLTVVGHNNSRNYDVSGNKLTKGYDYNLVATGRKNVILDSVTLTGHKKLENKGYYYNVDKKSKTHTVVANGKKTVTLESGILKANTEEDKMEEFFALDLIKQKYEFTGGIGGDEENPHTSDNILWTFTIGGISMIGLAATNKYRKKEE